MHLPCLSPFCDALHKKPRQPISENLGHVVVALADALVSANLGILRSRFSMRAWSSASSVSVTALGSILMTSLPPELSMLVCTSRMACSSVEIP